MGFHLVASSLVPVCQVTRRLLPGGLATLDTRPNNLLACPSHLPERAGNNMHTTATRVTKEIVKNLVKQNSQMELGGAQK